MRSNDTDFSYLKLRSYFINACGCDRESSFQRHLPPCVLVEHKWFAVDAAVHNVKGRFYQRTQSQVLGASMLSLVCQIETVFCRMCFAHLGGHDLLSAQMQCDAVR